MVNRDQVSHKSIMQRTRNLATEGPPGPPHDDLDQERQGTEVMEANNDKLGSSFRDVSLPPISPMKPYGRKLKSQRESHGRTFESNQRFRLDWEFKHKMRQLPEPWKGINGAPDNIIAQIVFERTYQRGGESWAGTVMRVVEGTYNMQMRHFRKNGLPWSFRKAQKSAQEMASRIFSMKFLPPGRGLWAMGAPIIEERHLNAALQNCAFISTENMDRNPTEAFIFCMDTSMLGVGVGFDTKGAGRARVFKPTGSPDTPGSFDMFVVSDSRSGWVESVRLLLESYFRNKRPVVQYDYSEIRPKGIVLKGFGGVSSGHEPLMLLHERIRSRLNDYIGKSVDSRLIVDLMNLIGKCVVSGNIRRTAEIAFGSPDDVAFMDLKNYEINPERSEYGWTSNNSILATVGINYEEIAKRIQANGEPGLGWIDNMRNYGRMCDPPTDRDKRISGANPCMEMGLESQELCNLVETFPARHESLADYMITLRYAFLYAKTVTLEATHLPKTNEIMMRNRRIGTSVTGISQFVAKHGLNELKHWLDTGYNYIQRYDKHLSGVFCIPISVKTTTVKPSGTVSLLAGATPGMHFPISQNYIRRITINNDCPLLDKLRTAGYHIEPKIICVGKTPEENKLDDHSSIVSIPVSLGKHVTKTEENVTMWEQLTLAAFLQTYWADNQVSCTVKFDPVTEGPHIATALEYFQYQLKGISFLPKKEMLEYPQLPYEPISFEQYLEMSSNLKPLDPVVPVHDGSSNINGILDDTDDDDQDQSLIGMIPDSLNFCDGDQCQMAL